MTDQKAFMIPVVNQGLPQIAIFLWYLSACYFLHVTTKFVHHFIFDHRSANIISIFYGNFNNPEQKFYSQKIKSRINFFFMN